MEKEKGLEGIGELKVSTFSLSMQLDAVKDIRDEFVMNKEKHLTETYKIGLCGCFYSYMDRKYDYYFRVFDKLFPLFNYQNALKFIPKELESAFWWNNDPYDFDNRLAFLDWMVEELKKQVENTENTIN